MNSKPRRPSLRLSGYAYRTPGAYFVTIWAEGRKQMLDDPSRREVIEACWRAIPAHFPQVSLDAFVVMPNHVHGILHIQAKDSSPLQETFRPSIVQAGSLSAIVRSFKAASTKHIHLLDGENDGAVWQRNYYDGIVTDQRDLERLREYIANNPANWRHDAENPERDPSAEYLKAWSWVETPQGAAVLRPYADLPNR